MKWLQQWAARVRESRALERQEREMAEEMAFHLEASAGEYERQGHDAVEARRLARVRFGSVERFKEEGREVERVRWLEQLLEDLRYAGRTFARQKVWALGIVLVLALGVGANTAVFSLVDAVLFRAPDAVRASELVRVYTRIRESDELTGTSYPLYLDYRARSRHLSAVAASSGVTRMNVVVGAAPAERVRGAIVSGNYFVLLGTRPALGRLLTADDDRVKGAHAQVVLSHDYWQRRLGGRKDVLGQALQINGQPFVVTGVAPRGFRGESFDQLPDLWVPVMMVDQAQPRWSQLRPIERRGFAWLDVIARLRPGSNAEQAAAELSAIASAVDERREQREIRVLPASATTIALTSVGAATRLSWILLAVVGLVLVLACADVAALLVARAEQRRRELAVRFTLGATRGRLIRQLITENLLLALAGSVAGLFIAALLRRILPALAPADFVIPIASATALTDVRVVSLAIITVLVMTLLFGVAPALAATRFAMRAGLRGPLSRLRVAGWLRLTLRDTLVIVQIALCLIFLTGAALLARSVQNAARLELGFARAGVVSGTIDLSRSNYDRARAQVLYRTLLERLRSEPGVQSAALALNPTIDQTGLATSTSFEGHVYPNDDAMPVTDVNLVTPGYLGTVGITLLRGRNFTDADVESSTPVVLVSKALADRYWPGQDPIGKHIGAISTPPAQVVGVVATTKYRTLRDAPRPLVYMPLWQMDFSPMSIVLRTDLERSAAQQLLVRTVAELDASVPVFDVATVQERLGDAFAQERLLAGLLGSFALLGLVLSAAGLFALVSFDVRSRMREWGVRIAIGARPAAILRQVQAGGARIAIAGLALGLAGALLLTRFLQSLLFEVAATDAWSYGLACAILLIVALTASYLPARSAARTDAVRALRSE